MMWLKISRNMAVDYHFTDYVSSLSYLCEFFFYLLTYLLTFFPVVERDCEKVPQKCM